MGAEKYFFSRKCSVCGRGMNEGYILETDCIYACNEECLDKLYKENGWGTYETYLKEWEDYDSGESDYEPEIYYTEWYDDDLQYVSENEMGEGAREAEMEDFLRFDEIEGEDELKCAKKNINDFMLKWFRVELPQNASNQCYKLLCCLLDIVFTDEGFFGIEPNHKLEPVINCDIKKVVL